MSNCCYGYFNVDHSGHIGLDLSIKQNQFVSLLACLKGEYIHDGCIWLAACHKTQKAETRNIRLLTVIGRGHKTLMHSGVGV
jgi:hypothetical protein